MVHSDLTIGQAVSSTLAWIGFYAGVRTLPGARARQSRWIIGSAVVAAAWLVGVFLLGAADVTFIGVANAEQVIVYEAQLDDSTQTISADFAVNRKLGRAWVDVQVQSIQIGSEPTFDPPIPRQVYGLYYDAARKQLLYRTATGPIVCAEDLGGTHLKSTGNCRLTPSSGQRMVDDGFYVHEQRVAEVVFDAQAGGAPQQAAASR